MTILCLHQVFRPSRRNIVERPGVGECYDCEYDPECNPDCSDYYPITITTCRIKE